MEQNYKLIPPDKQYKGAPLVDTTLNINLEDTNRALIEGDITVPLNLAERFNDERQNFSLYRLYGKLQPYIENAYSGRADQTQSNLIYNMYLTTNFLVLISLLPPLILLVILISRNLILYEMMLTNLLTTKLIGIYMLLSLLLVMNYKR